MYDKIHYKEKKKKKKLKGNWEKGKISVNHILSKDLVPMLLKKKKKNFFQPNNTMRNNPNEKVEFFFQRRQTNGQQAHENKFKIICH